MQNKLIILVPVIIAASAAAIFAFPSGSAEAPLNLNAPRTDSPALLPISANILDGLGPDNPFGLTEPVAQFRDRITKKTFGMFITPETSPVENDRFSGYHTGIDAEFTDTGVEIPVFAVDRGTVVTSRFMNGYGGVVVIKHVIGGIPVFALYGHLDPASLISSGTHVAGGDRVGFLGDDHSEETDGVRKHLHFAVRTAATMDYRGYVPAEDELAGWADPLSFF